MPSPVTKVNCFAVRTPQLHLSLGNWRGKQGGGGFLSQLFNFSMVSPLLRTWACELNLDEAWALSARTSSWMTAVTSSIANRVALDCASCLNNEVNQCLQTKVAA